MRSARCRASKSAASAAASRMVHPVAGGNGGDGGGGMRDGGMTRFAPTASECKSLVTGARTPVKWTGGTYAGTARASHSGGYGKAACWRSAGEEAPCA
jgi:hypothetical protein